MHNAFTSSLPNTTDSNNGLWGDDMSDEDTFGYDDKSQDKYMIKWAVNQKLDEEAPSFLVEDEESQEIFNMISKTNVQLKKKKIKILNLDLKMIVLKMLWRNVLFILKN